MAVSSREEMSTSRRAGARGQGPLRAALKGLVLMGQGPKDPGPSSGPPGPGCVAFGPQFSRLHARRSSPSGISAGFELPAVFMVD